ncbi:hypothetical protein ACFFQF_33790 [Haladaptatus pallidirubidus]
MAIGLPLKDRNQPLDDAVYVHISKLITHYLRAASTGSGKSKSVLNDMLTLSEHVGGPTVLLESKGDGMVENYLKAHYAKFGTLDNVYHFDAPDMLLPSRFSISVLSLRWAAAVKMQSRIPSSTFTKSCGSFSGKKRTIEHLLRTRS